MTRKLIWRVDPKPTGRYRSFAVRSWPMAHWDSPEGKCAAHFHDVERVGYHPSVAENTHLIVRVADYRTTPQWEWRTLKARPYGLKAAKELVQQFFDKFPSYIPKD